MFNNRFNSKNDPVLEAVTNAMKDGEMRRQAVAIVNEEFGVYSRNALVREDLAAYDARLEEAYKCMKEGKPLADKDYDKDGKIESGKAEYQGSRIRAAKEAGKLEELKDSTLKSYVDKSKKELKDTKDQTGVLDKDRRGTRNRLQGIGMASVKMKKEETDYSAQDRAPVTKSPKGYEDPSTPKVPYSQLPKTGNRAGAVIDSAKGALKEDEQLDELKQSTVRSYIEKSMEAAKAKRDAGFKKDFSEKKGKKAEKARGEFHKRTKGLGLAAKRLKEERIEELSQFGAAFAAARKAGQSDFKFGNKSFTTAMKGSSTPTPPSRPAGLGADKPVGDTGYKSGSTVSLKPIGGDGSAMAADNKPEAPRPAPTPGWKSPKPVDQGATVSASGGTPSVQSATKAPTSAPLPPSRPADLGASKSMQNPDQEITKAKGLKESVQVGENTYRIV